MNCPIHDRTMQRKDTRYGWRWGCTVEGCTVACWDGGTSTPADQDTRDLRHECHQVFDPLWRGKARFKRRGDAYAWLAKFMAVKIEHAHIGHFDREQCRRLLDELKLTHRMVTQ